MTKILLAYSTVDGHTLTICERIRRALEAAGGTVTLVTVEQAASLDLAGFDKIAIGASIRYGKHRPNVAEFVERHASLLASRPSAFFSVNIVARKPEKNRAETNPYVRKFLARVPWKPALADVFAGRLNYPALGPVDRTMIRFIMWITKGPTDPTGVYEFTDWARVDAFAAALARL